MGNEIKPYSTIEDHGVSYVKEMVSPQVRHILETMEANPGAYVLRKSIFNFAKLHIPNSKPMTIKQCYVLDIIQWLDISNEYIADNVYKYLFSPDAMKYIRRMEKKQ